MNDPRSELGKLRDCLAIAEAEVKRLHGTLPRCLVCGPAVRIDEDGCCASCGRDCVDALTGDMLRSETATP